MIFFSLCSEHKIVTISGEAVVSIQTIHCDSEFGRLMWKTFKRVVRFWRSSHYLGDDFYIFRVWGALASGVSSCRSIKKQTNEKTNRTRSTHLIACGAIFTSGGSTLHFFFLRIYHSSEWISALLLREELSWGCPGCMSGESSTWSYAESGL